MASDVKIATQYAVNNNNPQSFRNISQEPELAEQNFSARNVNPEYISRYQAMQNTSEDGVVYFEEEVANNQNQVGNIHAYDNYSTSGNRNNGFNSPNINFNFGMGMGFGGMMSPWGFYDPFWGPGFGFRPGLSLGIGLGWGNPFMGGGFGWGNPWRNPFMGFGGMMSPWGFYDPFFGPGFGMMGYGMGFSPWGRPIHAGRPIFILPGAEGDRRTVYGARPTRGATLANSGMRSSQAGVIPSTARAQARGYASAVDNSSARRLVPSENSRVASRDFSNSQNDYYNSGRSRVAPTTRNTNSPASDRGVSTRSRSTIPSARTPNNLNPSSNTRTYSPSGTSSPAYNNNRSTSPSFNRSTSPSYNRSTAPSYNRSTNPTNNNRVVTPSRTNSTPTFSAPSRSSGGGSFSAPSRSSGGGSFSAPSRSSGGFSGGSVGGSRGGRGN
ncbi:MAG: hypothetical protein C0433_17180 [Cyclobacterium sp.]|nr:hypothetical protein [Cyclobacterium sp.]